MQPVINGFLQQGVLGLAVIAMGFAIYKLWNFINNIQEKRIAEARESVKAIEQNTNTLDTMTEVLRAQGRTGQ